MPNHVATVLTISGAMDEIKRFIQAVDSGEENRFSFEKILPMPKELEGTRSPVLIQT